MGRKGGGRKGFLRGASGRPEDAGEAETPADGPAQGAAAPQPEEGADGPPAHQPALPATSLADGGDGGGDSQVTETLSQMRSRHVKEMKDHKKQMDKLGKKQKDEVKQKTEEIEKRHADEIAALKKVREGDEDAQPEQHAPEGESIEPPPGAEAMASLSLYDTSGNDRKPSKSQRRKQKLAAQEAERETRIAAEKEAMGPTERALEDAKLQEILSPLQLVVREVPADGHCMYRALEDQLEMAKDSEAPDGGYQGLRKLAAEYMRSHAEELMPFVVEAGVGEDPGEQFEQYCTDVESTAAWGGQVELGALAKALKRHIVVYSTDIGRLDMGAEFEGPKASLNVCYHRHAYGLGEHYNSIGPLA